MFDLVGQRFNLDQQPYRCGSEAAESTTTHSQLVTGLQEKHHEGGFPASGSASRELGEFAGEELD